MDNWGNLVDVVITNETDNRIYLDVYFIAPYWVFFNQTKKIKCYKTKDSLGVHSQETYVLATGRNVYWGNYFTMCIDDAINAIIDLKVKQKHDEFQEKLNNVLKK